MKARFVEVPEAVQNTLEVAEKCNLEIEFNKPALPTFQPPEHFTREGYLRQLLCEGLQRRYTIRARAEGKAFIVDGIEDPSRLPTLSRNQDAVGAAIQVVPRPLGPRTRRNRENRVSFPTF